MNEFDILDHPSGMIYRLIFNQNNLIIKECVGEYPSNWKLVKNKRNIISLLKFLILKDKGRYV